MRSRLSSLCLLFICFLGTSLSLWGQNASSVVHGIPGYLNPRTGQFRPMQQAEPQDAVEPPATTTFTGKIVVNFTITVDSVIASTNKVSCTVNASVEDAATANFIEESAAVAVTRGTGSTVTCSVTIPYSWKLGSPTTDSVRLTYIISSPAAIATPAGEFPLRTSSQTIGAIKVPSTGTTTTETVTATI